MFDVVVIGGVVVDGTGSKSRLTDVGINGDRITCLGDLSNVDARRVIDASGLVVSPGFIDTHAHSEGVLLINPLHPQAIRQGITTEILGQDGLSYAPLSSENYVTYNRYLGGILGAPPTNLDMSNIESFRLHYHKKCSTNNAYLVPHGAIRLVVLGFEDAPLVGKNLERACQLIRDGLEQGAVGFATGMSYHPNAWSNTEELVALCKVVREIGGVYVTHLRDVNTDRGFGGGGVPEAIEIGRLSGVPVHFSHYRTNVETAGNISDRMNLIDKAKLNGLDCTLDIYPYASGSTFATALLPSHAHEGGPDRIIDRLKNKNERSDIIRSMNNNEDRPLHEIILSYVPRCNILEGTPLVVEAENRGLSLAETLCDLLIEEDLQIGYWGKPPDDIAKWRQISRDSLELLSRPDYMVGSDSIHLGRYPHPRAYGTFPRFIGRFRRQFNLLSLEQIIQRVTGNPAKRFGLTDRGFIREGYFADLTIFDDRRIIDNSTYDDPCQFPTGIPFVLVNGDVVVDDEKCTGVLAGQAIP